MTGLIDFAFEERFAEDQIRRMLALFCNPSSEELEKCRRGGTFQNQAF